VLLALDVSGSMDGSRIAGSCLTAREASAAMALVTAATEPEGEIIAFSAPSGGGYGGMHGGGEPGITRVTLSPRMRLDDVMKRIQGIPMGGTDCALPMVWAGRNQLKVSAFITYTDSETFPSDHIAQRTSPLGPPTCQLVALGNSTPSEGSQFWWPSKRTAVEPVGCVLTSPTHVYPGPVGVDIKCSMRFLQLDLPADQITDKPVLYIHTADGSEDDVVKHIKWVS
jgi:hypothetical protein